MKKKLLVAALALSCVFVLAGCGEGTTSEPGADVTTGEKRGSDEINTDEFLKSLGEYSNLTIPATLATVTDADVDATIQNLINARVKNENVEGRALKAGDIANINYEGKMNGEAFEGGTDNSEQGYDLEIGSNSFIPGFEDALIGMEIGETRDIDLVFPEQYYEELAGKPVVFTVTLKGIKEKVYPELTDEFVVEQQIDGVETVAALKTFVKERLESEAKTNYETAINNAIMNQLVNTSQYADELPQDRVQYYYDSIYNRDEKNATDYGLQLEGYVIYTYGYSDLDMYKEKLTDYAKKSVMFDLAVAKILENENQMVTDEDVDKAVNDEYEKYGFASADELKANTDMDEFKMLLMNKRAIDIVREKATIIDAIEE